MKRPLSLIAAVLALSAGPASAQWMFRGGPAHSGTADAGPRQAPRVKWRFPTGDRIVSSPVWHEGVVYFGSDDGRVYAVEAASGRQLWMTATNGPVGSTPAVSGGVVYATSYDGRLYALDARSGARRWTFATGGERRFEAKNLHGFQPARQTFFDPYDVYLSSPAVEGGVVYFGSGDGRVYAVDGASGRERWHVQTGDVVHASPAVAGGVVYVGSWDGDLYALDAASGQERWRYDNEGSWVVGSPAVTNGRVYFATSDSRRFHVLDAATGKVVASQTSGAYLFSSPTVAGDVVLIGVLNGTLEARDAGTGALLWSYEVEASRGPAGRVLAADRTFDQAVLFPSGWGADPYSSFVRQGGVGSIFSTPLVAGGLVLFGSTDGALYALE